MKYKFTEEELKKAVSDSKTISDVCRKLNIVICGSNFMTLKKRLKSFNIDISHFLGHKWSLGTKLGRKETFNFRIKMEDILTNKVKYISSNNLRIRLIREGYKEHKCENCKLYIWADKPIPLELHHINGDRFDNNLKNIQILCPNCHALTHNYCGKNTKIHQNKLKLIELNKNLPPLIKQPRVQKQKEIDRALKQRRVNRPTYEELINDLKNKSYLSLSRKYGVSDNAIRKWVKSYEDNIQKYLDD